MRRVCAWCNDEYDRETHGTTGGDDIITHGICRHCEDSLAANRPTSLRGFLNRLDVPVLCVGEDVAIVTANDAAVAALGLDPDHLGDRLCGELLECVWARRAEGCGRSEHCLACAVRLMVIETRESGRGLSETPAYLDRITDGGNVTRVHMTISTERFGDVVLLRIDTLKTEPCRPSTESSA